VSQEGLIAFCGAACRLCQLVVTVGREAVAVMLSGKRWSAAE
jgi:hypothetical protein